MTLKAESLEEMQWPETMSSSEANSDPFFSKEDYETEDADDEGDVDDGNESSDAEDDSSADFMQAMDREPRRDAGHGLNAHAQTAPDDAAMAENIEILSNLFKSLDAEGGASGPVQNILRELGIQPPKLLDEK